MIAFQVSVLSMEGGGTTPIDQNPEFNVKQEREYKMSIYYILTKGLLLGRLQLNINWDIAVNYRLRRNYASYLPLSGRERVDIRAPIREPHVTGGVCCGSMKLLEPLDAAFPGGRTPCLSGFMPPAQSHISE